MPPARSKLTVNPQFLRSSFVDGETSPKKADGGPDKGGKVLQTDNIPIPVGDAGNAAASPAAAAGPADASPVQRDAASGGAAAPSKEASGCCSIS
ncbi:hypothetical protein DIPPA_19878 [Diplonema papillatum]|nr:hypothetical protein DIPPA_19878 [Diplonema papillatum]